MKINGKLFIILMPALITFAMMGSCRAEVSKVEIYLSNLEGQIEGLSFKSTQEPNSILPLVMLSQLWYEKSGYTGNPYDTLKAIQLITNALAKSQHSQPTDSSSGEEIEQDKLYLVRSRQQMRIHKFDDARKDLEKARSLGADEKQVREIQIDLDWNMGHYEQALKMAQEESATAPDRLKLIHLAGLEHELGDFELANIHYQTARTLSDNSVYLNPIQRAWLEVQIGINFSKMKDYDQSLKAFRSAIEIAPNYNMALEHLAETLAEIHQSEESIAIYEKIVKQSDDPEFMGQLAKLYRLQNRTKQANKWARKARKRYHRLLKDFPEAMYWHASNFYLEEGQNPKLALKLLEKNVHLRPNSISYLALAKVQKGLKLYKQAGASILRVLAMEPHSGEICELAKLLIKKNNRLLIQKCHSNKN